MSPPELDQSQYLPAGNSNSTYFVSERLIFFTVFVVISLCESYSGKAELLPIKIAVEPSDDPENPLCGNRLAVIYSLPPFVVNSAFMAN
jgi:hypothetical protein